MIVTEIPLKKLSNKNTQEIKKLIINIISIKDDKEKIKIANQIDSIIYKEYQLSDNEISYVEDFFSKQINTKLPQ